MKTLEELGASPAPWRDRHCGKKTLCIEARRKCPKSHDWWALFESNYWMPKSESEANARLIAAAPELYEALREAIIEECQYCAYFNPNDLACHKDNNDKCFALNWRKALAKAGGGE